VSGYWEALCECGVGVEVLVIVFTCSLNEVVVVLGDEVQFTKPHFHFVFFPLNSITKFAFKCVAKTFTPYRKFGQS